MYVGVQLIWVTVVVGSLVVGFLAGLIVNRNWHGISFLVGRAGSLLRGHPPYESWPEPIVGLNSSGTIRYLNHAASELFDYPEQDVRGEPISTLIRGAAFQHAARAIGQLPGEVFLSNCGMEAEGVRRDGQVFPVSCVPLGRSFILVRDESDRAHLSELQRRAELLAVAFEMNPTPLLIFDRERRVIAANRTSDRLFGSPVRDRAHLNELFPRSEE